MYYNGNIQMETGREEMASCIFDILLSPFCLVTPHSTQDPSGSASQSEGYLPPSEIRYMPPLMSVLEGRQVKRREVSSKSQIWSFQFKIKVI